MRNPRKIAKYSTAAVAILGFVCVGATHVALPPPSFFGGLRFNRHLRRECRIAVQDSSSNYHAWCYNAASVRIKPPTRILGPRGLTKYLRSRMPARWRIWRDRRDKNVVHVALRRLLAWKKNPLNARLTIHGVYTIRQVEKKFIEKVCPGTIFSNSVPSLPGTGGNPMAPDYKEIETPLRFNIKNMTLQQFLTSGFGHHISYEPPPRWFGRFAWEALFRLRDGKFALPLTLNIEFYYTKLVPSAVVHQPPQSRGRQKR